MASFSCPQFQLTSTQTALAFIVPEHIQSEINSLRRIHDKAFSKWQPHINILYPFVEPSRLSSAVAILRESLNKAKSFKVSADEVAVFRHRKNATVFLKPGVESEENICSLRRDLVSALGCKERDGTHDGTFRPHLTVGQAGLNGAAIEKLIEQVGKLVSLNWEGSTLAVLKREISGEMKIVGELSLGVLDDDSHDSSKIPSSNTGWRPCYSFKSNKEWNQIPKSLETFTSRERTSTEVTISTYNLMAESFAPSFKSRLQVIINSIFTAISLSNSSLRVLCLQEINDEMLPLLLGQRFIQEEFPFSTHMPSSLLPSHRNLVILASRPFKNFSLQFSERHKTALIASFYEFPVEVANVHLTSALTNEAVVVKKSQLETLTKFFSHDRNTAGKEVIVAGDFNLTTSSRTIEVAVSRQIITPETARLVGSVIDPTIWEDTFNVLGQRPADYGQEIFEGEEGATFNRLSNALAAMTKSLVDYRPERYDRVLLRNGGRMYPEHFELFGVPDHRGHCASDHFGVCVRLRIDQADDADLNNSAVASSPRRMLPGAIEVIEDSTGLQPLLEPYLPTDADRKQREQALELLQATLTSNKSTADLVFATLGSYLMDTYFADSDVDMLIIGSVAQHVFFDFATAQLRALGTSEENGFKGVHFVNSLVSVVEVCVMGIKFDLQYCQAAELVQRYHYTNPRPDLKTLVFDNALMSSLSPSSIRPLNTYRDTAYLLNTLPDLPSSRTSHRFLSLYLKSRGLYSAKFGYLGGVHLSLMLNRVVKLIAAASSNQSELGSSNVQISPATIIRTFFEYYSKFNWAEDSVTDTSLPSHRNVSRSPRDSIFIYSIHTPTARRNVASSCTRLTAQSLTQEFGLANEKLRLGNWQWCLRERQDGVKDLLEGFGAFVRVQVDVWDVDEIGGDRFREMVGGLESKFPRLMVSLGRISGLDGRVWPARFRVDNDEASGKQTENGKEGKEFKGYYLVGVSGREEMDVQQKKIFTGKVITAVREFERDVKESREFVSENMWMGIEVVPRKKILDMELVLDERDWGRVEKPNAVAVEPREAGPAEFNADSDMAAAESSPLHARNRRPNSTFLRPAQDIISRIQWDPTLSVDDFVIGYEDRFVGVKETELGKWKTEQTDEEFIPMHRIVWVRRKGEDGGEIVWDRRKKADLIFGSGVSQKSD